MKIIKDINGNFRGFVGTGKELLRFYAKIQDREFNERLRRAREKVKEGCIGCEYYDWDMNDNVGKCLYGRNSYPEACPMIMRGKDE